ncbi:MAG: cPAF [Bacteriovoracaceae bacterium]|nr:cPAF [Bacteriovoracaceae bacterium]
MKKFIIFISVFLPGFLNSASAHDRDFSEFDYDQKLEDFHWVVGQIDEYYGLMDYKEKRFNFSWDDLKTQAWNAIAFPTVDRTQFQNIVQGLVARLSDAHTSVHLMRDYMMNGAYRYATPGFTTRRTPYGIAISHLFVKFFGKDTSSAPVQVGDIIVSINGKTPEEVIASDITSHRNLGNDQSNLTMGAYFLTLRQNTMFADLPTGNLHLVLARGEKEITVDLPWHTLNLEDLAAPESQGQTRTIRTKIRKVIDSKTVIAEFEKSSLPNELTVAASYSGLKEFKGRILENPDVLSASKLKFAAGMDYPGAPLNQTFNGLPFTLVPTKGGLVAIYRVEDFEASREVCEQPAWQGPLGSAVCHVLKGEDYATAFAQLKGWGVNKLILDLRQNGGGALDYGYELVRAFQKEKFPLNLASLRLNEEWVSQFKYYAEWPGMPIYWQDSFKKTFDILQKDIADGKKFSTPVGILGMDKMDGVENAWDGKTYILADEMCASMCDIFTTLMQDLKVATFIGTRTMGAGGNIIDVGKSPRTKIALNLTASRILRLNGDSIENVGATPDVEAKDSFAYWPIVLSFISADQ